MPTRKPAAGGARRSTPNVPLTPHDVRVVNRVAEVLIGALATMPPLDRVRLAEVLVDRIRTHYHLGTTKPCSKPSSSSPP